MREDADFDFHLNSEIFDNLSQLIGIFIYILLVIKNQRTQPLQYEQFRDASLMRSQFKLPEQLCVYGDGIEGGNCNEQQSLQGVVFAVGRFGQFMADSGNTEMLEPGQCVKYLSEMGMRRSIYKTLLQGQSLVFYKKSIY